MEIKKLTSFMALTVMVLLSGKSLYSAGNSQHVNTCSNSKQQCVPVDTVKTQKNHTENVSNPPQSEINSPAGETIVAVADKEILVFINPNGRPCQMQLSILDGMKDKLSKIAKIKYIKTTEESDQNTFYQYGIRGLPSLIILGKDGKEIKRFTPGIQNEKTILSALDILNK